MAVAGGPSDSVYKNLTSAGIAHAPPVRASSSALSAAGPSSVSTHLLVLSAACSNECLGLSGLCGGRRVADNVGAVVVGKIVRTRRFDHSNVVTATQGMRTHCTACSASVVDASRQQSDRACGQATVCLVRTCTSNGSYGSHLDGTLST
jgi:hypothetical protein